MISCQIRAYFFVNIHMKLLSPEAFLQPKMQQISFGGRAPPGPNRGPKPIAGLRGPTSKGRQKKEGVEGKGKICLVLIFLLATPLLEQTINHRKDSTELVLAISKYYARHQIMPETNLEYFVLSIPS